VTSTTVRGERPSASSSQRCTSTRVSASRAANGSSKARTGLPDSSVRRKATRWRIPPDSASGRACSKALEPELGEQRVGLCARRGAGVAGHAQRERSVVERGGPREQEVALGHVDGGRTSHGAGIRSLQPADQLEQRGLAATARPTTAHHLVLERVHGEVLERGDGAEAGVTPRTSTEVGAETIGAFNVMSIAPFAGNYPTGSKGQRRAVPRALSQPATRQPPWFSTRPS
jgi:hypothetical protein